MRLLVFVVMTATLALSGVGMMSGPSLGPAYLFAYVGVAVGIESTTPEILGTESEWMPVRIDTTMGHFIADFDSVALSLDTGQPLPYESLKRVCEEYWTEWQGRAEQAAAADARKAVRR